MFYGWEICLKWGVGDVPFPYKSTSIKGNNYTLIGEWGLSLLFPGLSGHYGVSAQYTFKTELMLQVNTIVMLKVTDALKNSWRELWFQQRNINFILNLSDFSVTAILSRIWTNFSLIIVVGF